uniref:Ig-like domain-containing protein n=1 Tax=Catharus ustulatus TaxID=91951 RepID=A0A8C3TN92_CATUS
MDGHGKLALLSGSALRTGVLSGNSAFFSVEIQSLKDLSSMSREDQKCSKTTINDTLLARCGTSAGRLLNLENGSLVLRRVEKDDEGKYEFVFQNTSKKFTLEVLEPTIGIQCFPDGTAQLSCHVASRDTLVFRWLLNGTHLKAEGACIKDAGKKVHLDKTEPGEFVCEVLKGNSVTRTRPITLSCSYDLLQYPGFIYILAGCAAGVLILLVALPATICCCMRRRHKFIPVPSEEEKDDGLTMSVVSGEGTKSPPNGDRVEAQAAQTERPPKPDAAQTGQGVEPQPLPEENFPVQIEAEEMPAPEVLVDMESQEDASDCFPDPTDD